MKDRRAMTARAVRFLLLCLLSALMLAPLAWALAASLRPPEVPFALGSVFFHSSLSTANYQKAFSLAPFARYYMNTVLQVALIIGMQLLTASLAAFALRATGLRGTGSSSRSSSCR